MVALLDPRYRCCRRCCYSPSADIIIITIININININVNTNINININNSNNSNNSNTRRRRPISTLSPCSLRDQPFRTTRGSTAPSW